MLTITLCSTCVLLFALFVGANNSSLVTSTSSTVSAAASPHLFASASSSTTNRRVAKASHMSMSMKDSVIRPDVLQTSSYPTHDAHGLVKLDAMENPFSLPPALAAGLGTQLASIALNRYPASRAHTLVEKIRRAMHIPKEYDILLGNGSDEIISMMSVACARPGAKVLAPMPGFVMYEIYAQFAGLEFVGVPLRAADFSLDTDAMIQAIVEHRPALVYLAYPNNPTGTLYADADMERIVAAAAQTSSLVVVDEAYQPFAQQTWLPRIAEFDNVVVLRTFSKLGLAGIRLGYLVGAPAWLNEFDKVRPPYNVNALTQATATFLLDHIDVLDEQAALLRAERTRLVDAVSALPGVQVFPSAGNFVLVRVADAAALFESLLSGGVLIKNVSGMHPLLRNCVRITVGAPEENDLLLSVLKHTFR